MILNLRFLKNVCLNPTDVLPLLEQHLSNAPKILNYFKHSDFCNTLDVAVVFCAITCNRFVPSFPTILNIFRQFHRLFRVSSYRLRSSVKMTSECILTEVSSNKIFGGLQKVYSHESKELGCKMSFGVYFPPNAEERRLPVIYWLSGLTCSEENFIQKAGAQRYASENSVILVNPDTSPRGLNIPGDSDSWDFGVGAGFYVNATEEPWKKNYKMFNYVTVELMAIVNANFNVLEDKQSIMGHSMGGHGALICALKNPGLYKSVSAFAPISNPMECPWGQKAFSGYLGPRVSGAWNEWDATELAQKYNGPPLEILVDQGTEDNFYKAKQLLPENLQKATTKSDSISCILKMREGYNHSYFYIASFVGEHIAFHMKHLQN